MQRQAYLAILPQAHPASTWFYASVACSVQYVYHISWVRDLIGPTYCKCLTRKTSASVLFFCSLGCSAHRGHVTMLLSDWQLACAGSYQPAGGKQHLSQPRDSQESQSSIIFCINITGLSHAQKQTKTWRTLFVGMNLRQALFQHSCKK